MDRETSKEIIQEKLDMYKNLRDEFNLHPVGMIETFMQSQKRGELPDQGVKLHVTADDSKDYLNLLDRMVPLLEKYDMTYKVVNPMKSEAWLQKDIGIQSGKMITIYPTDNTNINFFSDPDVKMILSEETKMNIANEKSLGGRLFGRFGGVTETTIRDPITGKEYEDDRFQTLLEFVGDISLKDFIDQCTIGKEEGIEEMERFVPEHYIDEADRLEKNETETNAEKEYENVISDSYDYDEDGDMIREVVCETFNEEGNMIQETHVLKDGIEIERKTTEYDKDGNEISTINVSCDKFGFGVESVSSIEKEYDKNNELSNIKMEVENRNKFVEGVSIPAMFGGFVEIAYDGKGNSKEYLVDLNWFHRTVKEYEIVSNEKGEVIEKKQHFPSGTDFVNKFSDGKLIERDTFRYTSTGELSTELIRKYDSETGNEIIRIEKTHENDGTIIESRVEYDKNGDIISETILVSTREDINIDNSDKDDSTTNDNEESNDNSDDFENEYDPVD